MIKELLFNHKRSFFQKIKSISIPIYGLVLWIVSLIFEYNGGRANSQLTPEGFDLLGTLNNLIYVIRYKMRRGLLIFILALLFVSFVLMIIKHKKEYYKKNYSLIIVCCFCVVFTSLFIVLLCSKVGKQTIQRSDVLICIYFYVFLFVSVLLCTFFNKKIIGAFLPIIIIIICSYTFTGTRTFMESNKFMDPSTYTIESSRCIRIDYYLINQIVEAEKMGSDYVQVHVPVFDNSYNWPIGELGIKSMSKALYNHHIINRKITVDVVLDPEVNKSYKLFVE